MDHFIFVKKSLGFKICFHAGSQATIKHTLH